MVAVLIRWGGKSAQNTEFNELANIPVMWERPGAFPGIESFTVTALCIMGHFRGLWWFITPSKTWSLSLRSAQLRELCRIKRVEYLRVKVSQYLPQRGFHTWTSCVRAESGMTKRIISHWRSCFLLAFSLLWAKPQLLASGGGCALPLYLGCDLELHQVHCFAKWPTLDHQHFSLSQW